MKEVLPEGLNYLYYKFNQLLQYGYIQTIKGIKCISTRYCGEERKYEQKEKIYGRKNQKEWRRIKVGAIIYTPVSQLYYQNALKQRILIQLNCFILCSSINILAIKITKQRQYMGLNPVINIIYFFIDLFYLYIYQGW